MISTDKSPNKVLMANKHMKMCSMSLAVREIKIKAMMRYHYTPIIMANKRHCPHQTPRKTWETASPAATAGLENATAVLGKYASVSRSQTDTYPRAQQRHCWASALENRRLTLTRKPVHESSRQLYRKSQKLETTHMSSAGEWLHETVQTSWDEHSATAKTRALCWHSISNHTTYWIPVCASFLFVLCISLRHLPCVKLHVTITTTGTQNCSGTRKKLPRATLS